MPLILGLDSSTQSTKALLVDADSGADAAPSPSEIVDLRPDGTMALRVAAPETEWSRQNLDDDAQDGLGDPEPEIP